jgi:anti-anti-sigma factor
MSQFIKESTESGIRVLALTVPEQLETSLFNEVSDQILNRIDSEPQGSWVIDLSQVEYMGSTLLGLMVNIRQRVKESSGQLALCGLNERLDAVFRACSLINLFTICKTRAQAVRELG